MRKTIIVMKETWSVGERLFGNSYERRRKMFRVLVESVALYEAEIWG